MMTSVMAEALGQYWFNQNIALLSGVYQDMQGPTLPISQQIHEEKYRGPKESFREACSRQASTLCDDERHFQTYRDIILDQRFLPAGRVQSAVGSTRNVTPYNCFVAGTIEDSFVEGHGSIMGRAAEAAATMRQGGGIGYDFSTLRPRGAAIKKLHSNSTGPVSFMEIFDAVCRCVASSGHRRGAQMGVLRVDHPDIEEFIRVKQPDDDVQRLWDAVASIPDNDERIRAGLALQKTLRLTGFNVSVAITDEFMECLNTGKSFDLKFGGQVYKTVDAQALWNMIMRGTWDWAEPGVLFIDTINRMNNLWYCETIAATNPCGEQPLPPHGACLLGSFNLVKYVVSHSYTEGEPRTLHFLDLNQLLEDIRPVVRAMDNVVDRAKYPLYEQEKEAKAKRRMGLGVTGMANALEACGLPYGSPGFLELESKILCGIKNECYMASIELAKEKGAFKLYDSDRYNRGQFIQTLDEGVQSELKRYGIRNSHLTSIAPTGTISLCADNVSSSIEPVYAYTTERILRSASGDQVVEVPDYAYRTWGVKGKRASEVTVEEHLQVLLTAAAQVDSAVSKTCNVPGSVNWDDFKQLYVRAHQGGAKGCTTFRIDGKRTGILKTKDTNEEGASCTIDESGRRSCE
jgi:ribonucleoside-diphosphate reductase alpha chain